MSKHVIKGLAFILTFVIMMMLTAVPVLAFETREGDTVILGSQEVIDDDLYAAAASIIIDGTVNGDLWAVAQTISINGAVNGSVGIAARAVTVNGDVGHAVRAAGETVSINSNINGDLMAFGSAVNIASTTTVKCDLLVGAVTVRIDGLIEGDIKGWAGEAIIGGDVNGNVELEVDSLTILSTANIEGDLTYTGKEEADIQPGAQIGGTTTYTPPSVKPAKEKPDVPFPIALFSGMLSKLIGFLMALVTGLVIILIAPRRLMHIVESIRTRPGASAGWGALVLFATPIAAILICITIVGIPLGLIALILWGIGLYLAKIPVGLLIGRLIIGRFRAVERRAIMIGALALGLGIFTLLGLIPHLGFFVGLAVAIFGFGAVVVSIRRQRTKA